MIRFLISRLKRSGLASAGLLVCALGTYLQLQACIGNSPWTSLNIGLSLQTSCSYGTICILVSFAVILVDLVIGERIGIGTILDAFLVGWGVDFLLKCGLLSEQRSLPLQIVIMLLGLIVESVGQFLYMKAALCCGPRDALIVGVARRQHRFSIGTVNIILFLIVLAASMLLGAPIGIGTLIATFCKGPIMEGVFRLFRFNAEAVLHEDILNTAKAFCGQIKPSFGRNHHENCTM